MTEPNEQSPEAHGKKRSKITKNILSEIPEQVRNLTKDYWKGRADQHEIDGEQNTSIRQELSDHKKLISDLLIIAKIYAALPNHNKISKNATNSIIARAKALINKTE